jgi:hypothetical protein
VFWIVLTGLGFVECVGWLHCFDGYPHGFLIYLSSRGLQVRSKSTQVCLQGIRSV